MTKPTGHVLLVYLSAILPIVGCEKKPSGPEGTLGPEGEKLLAEKKLDVPGAGKELDLAFKFDPQDPVRYRMDIDADIEVTAGPIGRQTITMDMHLTFDQKTRTTGDPASVEIPFTKQKIGLDMNMAGQKIKVDVDSRDVVATADGMELVNTRTGVGEGMAGEFLKDLNFEGNSVTAKIDKRGRALDWKGEQSLVELFADNSGGEGFMPVTFPEGKVVVGVPWWAEFKLTKFQDIQLRGDPILGMTRFVVLGQESQDGHQLTKIRMDAPMRIEDRKAKIFLENTGQTADATFERLDRSGTGTILFDHQRGVVHTADVEIGVDGELELTVMGQDVNMHMKAKMKVGIVQVPREVEVEEGS